MKRIEYVILSCLPLCAIAQTVDVGSHTTNGSTNPRIISKAEPQYSEQARVAGIQGKVVIQMEVGLDGFAHNLQVIRTLASLDQRALEAIRLWRFQPAFEDGHPVVPENSVSVQDQ